MTHNAAVEADVLRAGFGLGYFTKDHVARWADQQIAAVDEPSIALIELSINQHVDPYDLLKYLSSLGHSNPEDKVTTEIGFIGLLFTSQQITTEKAIRSLWSLVHAAGISDQQQSQIYYLDDAYDLALAGAYGSMADVESALRAFVSVAADNLLLQHPQLFRVFES